MKEDENQKLEACLSYFKNRSVYQKLFQKMKEKYASLGHIGGKVVLTGLSREEKVQLGGFLQKDYSENETITVSVRLLEKRLSESRFSGVSLEELLRAYFDEALLVKKDEKEKEQKKREDFFAKVLDEHKDTLSGKWLKKVLDNQTLGYEICMQQYRENPAKFQGLLSNVLRGIEYLPVCQGLQTNTDLGRKKELLAVFAAKVTGNPHYFDTGTVGEKLLFAFLCDFLPEESDCHLSGTEQKNRLFYRAGILKDDLSNETLAYGIRAWKQDGRLHQGIEGFLKEQEPIRLTLRTLGEIQCAGAQQKNIYVIENPAVFSMIIEKNPNCTAVCVNGQPRMATLILMDFLQENHMFYYAGDFDPEGLLIAQRLKERYGEKLRFWNYETEWYYQFLSDVRLSEARIKKLQKVHLEELQPLKKCIQKEGKAAYQEAMMQVYLMG